MRTKNKSLALSLSVHREDPPPTMLLPRVLRVAFFDFVLFVLDTDVGRAAGVLMVAFVAGRSDLADDWLLLCDVLRAKPELVVVVVLLGERPWSGNETSVEAVESLNWNAASVA